MSKETDNNATPKVHPATREVLPDDPMEMHAVEIQGDTELMVRLLVEEYARMGWGLEQIMQLAVDSNYTGFHGLLQLYGEDELRRRISEIIAKCGVMRVTECEAESVEDEPVSEQLVQIDLPS